MNIQCIDNESAFLALRDEWEGLRLNSGEPSYFLSHDWIRCCWEELKSSNELRVFVVRDGDRPVLIAPWMIAHVSNNRLPATSLVFIEHPETQLSDILVRQESDGGPVLDHLLRYILRERGSEWNFLLLDKIRSDSQTARYFANELGEGVGISDSESSHQALIISLNRTWKEYLAEQSPRFRKTLRNIINRMHKLGRLDVRTYQGRPAAAEAIEKLFSISDASWKVADGVAITSSGKRMRFFKDLSERAITAEGLRIIILEVDGKPIASETQVIDRGVVYALRSDYDERYAESSPGTFLQMEILQELFAGPYMEYNFGVGLNPYKTRWTEERRELMRFRLYNHTMYGRLLRTVYRYEPKLSQLPGVRLVNNLFAGKS